MNALPDVVLDGELVVLDQRGKSSTVCVFAFALLELRGKDQRMLPLLKRKAALQKVLKAVDRIAYMQHIGESGVRLFHAAEQLGLEGIGCQARRFDLHARALARLGEDQDR